MRILAVFLALVLLPSAARAAPAMGSVGVFFDAEGTSRVATIEPSVPFDVWVVMTPNEGGVIVYELALSFPDDLVFLWGTAPRPCAAINCWGDLVPEAWLVGLGTCDMTVGPMWLVRVNLVTFTGSVAAGDQICVGAHPSSASDPPAPRYGRCDENLVSLELTPALDQVGAGCAQILTSEVGTAPVSWGALKASHGAR